MKCTSQERSKSLDSYKDSNWTTLNLAIKLLWQSYLHLSEGKIFGKASVESSEILFSRASPVT